MLKLKMLNQIHLVSNVVYLSVLLGPLLFLIYVNDMPNWSEKANIRTFADDSTPFYSSNSLQDLEKTTNEVFKELLLMQQINFM